jgi:hypothetical protein
MLLISLPYLNTPVHPESHSLIGELADLAELNNIRETELPITQFFDQAKF